MLPSSPHAILLLDEDHRVARCNAHAVRLLGFPSVRERVGQPTRLEDLVAEPFDPAAFELPRTVKVRRRDAPDLVVEMQINRLDGEGAEAWGVVLRDVTAARAEAHDLKNALMGALGSLELAKLAAGDRTLLLDRLATADAALRRATALAQAGKQPLRHPDGVRVLLMDDDPVVRDVLTEMLEQLGCRVTTVADGSAAVSAYRRSMVEEDVYGVVVLDLTVDRGMGGQETVRALREIDVRVHAIATSGRAFDPAMVRPVEHGFASAMAKPFSLVDLEKVLAGIKPSG